MQITESELAEIRTRYHADKIVLTGGGFDLIHCGHLDFLEASKRLGDVLVVALANDKELRIRKGTSRPIIAESLRARLVDALKPVDYTLVRADSDLANSLLAVAYVLCPDVLVLYADIPAAILAQFKSALPRTEVVIDRQVKVDSTTDIIQRLQRLDK